MAGGEYLISSNGTANLRLGSLLKIVAGIWVSIEEYMEDALLRLTKDNLQLSTRKPLSNTLMLAITISERLLGSTLAVQVELVRVGEDVLVPVTGLGGGDDALSSFDEL